MDQAVQTIAERAALGAAAGSGTGTALMGWFNVNAAGIGAICTIITCAVYCYIAFRNHYKRGKRKDDPR